MPLFEYVCRDCRETFETFVTGDRQPCCPACHGANLAKLLSRPGMVGTSAERSAEQAFGGCGAGGSACACRANAAH